MKDVLIDDEHELRRYEIGYLLVPIIGAEQVGTTVDTLIRGPIIAAGGQILGSGEPKLISLAYSMRKTLDNKNLRFKEGYFGSLFFTAFPHQISSLDQTFRSSPALLRFLITELPARAEEPVRRPKEIVSPTPLDQVSRPESGPVPHPMSQAEMDREIDELLV